MGASRQSNSIRKHSGFYIGRYEITGSLAKPTEKSGKVLTASNDEANNWYGLYNACKKIIQENRNVKSTMIYGVQWDAVCSWLSQSEYNTNTDSSEWGNYNGININTGSNTTYEANGIFDLASNYWEWTQEAIGAHWRILRGGNSGESGSEYPVTDRNYNSTSDYNMYNTSRAVLGF